MFRAALRGLVGKLTVVKIRRNLHRQATRFARKRVARIIRATDVDQALSTLTTAQRDVFLNVTRHRLQRHYFDVAEQAAREQRALLTRKLQTKLSRRQRRKTVKRLRKAEMVEDAAAVKPVQGQLPRNHQYAGKEYPMHQIDANRYPQAIAALRQQRRTGVSFSREGFPDFTPWTHRERGVLADVRITYKRNRPSDFRAADREMQRRLGDPRWRRPAGYTWHHHEAAGRMILVPEELHTAVGHTGGIPHYRMATGDYHAYP